MIKSRIQTLNLFLPNPAAGTTPLWRAPANCRVTALRAVRVGGTGAVVNAQKNDATDLLSADLSLASTAWLGGSTTLVTAAAKLNAGDTLRAEVVSVAGAPTGLMFQIDVAIDADVH